MDNAYADNLTYRASELAKRSSVSVSLSGWPAAFAIRIKIEHGLQKHSVVRAYFFV